MAHAKGDFNVAFARLRDAPISNSKMSLARLMFCSVLRFPGLPILPDEVDEVAAGVKKQAKKVVAKNRRNYKVSQFRKGVVDLEGGLHILLKDNVTKLFDIDAQVIRICEGGRSAYVQGKDKGGKVTFFLRNRRFIVVDPKYRVEVEAEDECAMATGEVEIAGDSCLLVKRLSRNARAALRRT